jgi:transcriptional regulator with XRE-family HTH domain
MKSPVQHKLMAVANNIRAQRLVKNYSQDYLAICLKISQNAYSKIEMGYTRITVERLCQIAIILDIDCIKLLEIPEKTIELNDNTKYADA